MPPPYCCQERQKNEENRRSDIPLMSEVRNIFPWLAGIYKPLVR
ncbi:hypothetical protein UC8_05980 [Roseimaritima ulvae]|uniref:Uncharacterized protein n=1 Tax=Roseimaritima ulvae TaxID=980254 RepID=A0A5B9QM05_9BACT|nr:hypothetical protein UC8_05980 [Roseimaritima ulvae]